MVIRKEAVKIDEKDVKKRMKKNDLVVKVFMSSFMLVGSGVVEVNVIVLINVVVSGDNVVSSNNVVSNGSNRMSVILHLRFRS